MQMTSKREGVSSLFRITERCKKVEEDSCFRKNAVSHSRARRSGSRNRPSTNFIKISAGCPVPPRCFSQTAILFLMLLLHGEIDALPSNDVTPIPPRQYFEQVHPLLQNAQKSIRLIIYEIRYYPRFKNSPTNLLIQSLIEARQRGVSVEVIVEESTEHARDNAQKNREAAALLEKAGILVYFDSPTTTTHDKVMVIDERYVVIGSTNWSYHAMEKNNESSVVIDSPELARYYLGYFEKLKH